MGIVRPFEPCYGRPGDDAGIACRFTVSFVLAFIVRAAEQYAPDDLHGVPRTPSSCASCHWRVRACTQTFRVHLGSACFFIWSTHIHTQWRQFLRRTSRPS